ncbi:MAG: glucose-1-phosphate thymidylyltransferase, partial [Chitinophagaceae bacterium]|nr:glucose-1-phosphate thymidylyltransferase [Chitinophagaceae bacterium]
VINAVIGPVYIGKGATVMDGAIIRGPLALCEGAVLKAGAKIYGATTLGPYCSGGGEIKNSVLQNYSNKAHDGYLGDSVIGSWCNLGAGTTNSNLKNTAGDIYMPANTKKEKINAGNKCGVIMGDYTRTAINSSINTGSIYGVCSNVFGEGLLPAEIESFIWGNKSDAVYQLDKALEDIARWKKLKNKSLSENEAAVLKHLFLLVLQQI